MSTSLHTFPAGRPIKAGSTSPSGRPTKLKTTPRAAHISGRPRKAADRPPPYPFQQWRYRHIDGVGDNIIIEFVDPTYTNEYRMTTDPTEKDALRYIPGAHPGNSFISVGGDPVVTVNASTAGPRITTVNVEQNAMEGQVGFHHERGLEWKDRR